MRRPASLFAGQARGHLGILVVESRNDDGSGRVWGEALRPTAIPATKAALETIVAPLERT